MSLQIPIRVMVFGKSFLVVALKAFLPVEVGFAIAYEQKSPVAFSLSAEVINRIPAQGLPLEGLGNRVGVLALIRHGFLRLDPENGMMVRLTPRGFDVKAAYDERIRAVEKEWCNVVGDEQIEALGGALQGIRLELVPAR